MLLPVLGLWSAVGLIGGAYPAFYLSRYRPSEVLKANQSTAEPRSGGRLRGVLVVGQFAVSIGLIVCTIVVYAQTAFAQRSDLGFEREGLIQVDNLNRAAVVPQVETMLREIRRIPGVERGRGDRASRVASEHDAHHQRPAAGPPAAGDDRLLQRRARTSSGRWRSGSSPAERSPAATPTITPSSRSSRPRRSRRRSERWRRAASTSCSNEAAVRRLGFASPAAALGGQIRVGLFGEEIGLRAGDDRRRRGRQPLPFGARAGRADDLLSTAASIASW